MTGHPIDQALFAELAADVLSKMADRHGDAPMDCFERDRCASDAACYALAAAGLIDFEELTARMYAQELVLMKRHKVQP